MICGRISEGDKDGLLRVYGMVAENRTCVLDCLCYHYAILSRWRTHIYELKKENDKKGKIVQRSQLCDHLVGRRDTMEAECNKTLPVSEKYMLTIKEAAAYFNIGIKRLRRIAEDNLGTVAVYCGNRFLIIRPKFEEFILNSSEI